MYLVGRRAGDMKDDVRTHRLEAVPSLFVCGG